LALRSVCHILILDGTTHHLHQLAQFTNLLFTDTLIDGIAFDKVFTLINIVRDLLLNKLKVLNKSLAI